jgi:hypothetical protein
MTTQSEDERRRFSRIPFDAIAHLKTTEGDLYLNLEVIDISLNGLLVAEPTDSLLKQDQQCHIDVLLEQGAIIIKMEGIVAHIDKGQVGLSCQEIDLESISHLKRLISLNLGDENLLNRELSALHHPN